VKAEDTLCELLDADQFDGQLVCLILPSLVNIFETLVQILGIYCECELFYGKASAAIGLVSSLVKVN
jgi:hypothetical protein